MTAKAPRVAEEEIEPLTIEEAQRLLLAASHRRNGTRWAVALALGVRQGEALGLPNGMAVTPDNATLIVAESYTHQLTAFDIAPDGSLLNRRSWAHLGEGVPDGICLDADAAIWYGGVPHQRAVRVREGGKVLQTIELDRGCFACTLGGTDGRTLFLLTRKWTGAADLASETRTGQILTLEAPARRADWP